MVEIGAKKEEAKTFDEEGVTGAVVRALKGGERNRLRGRRQRRASRG